MAQNFARNRELFIDKGESQGLKGPPHRICILIVRIRERGVIEGCL